MLEENIMNNTASYKTEDYCRGISELLVRIDHGLTQSAVELVAQAYKEDKTIFTAGNGGSAATAIHFAADFGKNAVMGSMRKPRVMALCANISTLTAYANDEGYDTVFERQLEAFSKSGDLLILISASGNSPNVVNAAQYAKRNQINTIALTGFSGGELMKIATISLHVPCTSYEPVEDIHSIYCHMLVSCVKQHLLA